MFLFLSFVASNDVFELDAGNVSSFMNCREPVVIKFYSPNCPYCQELAPKFLKVAQTFNNVKFGQINCVANETLCDEFNVFKYPQIQIRMKGMKPVDFKGESSSDSIIDFIEDNTARLSNRPRQALKVITPYNYEKMTKKANYSLILFSTPENDDYNSYLYNFKKVAQVYRYEEGAVIGKVDCQSYKAFCESQNIKKDPTFIEITKNERTEFEGEIEVESLVKHINKKADFHRNDDGLLDESVGLINNTRPVIKKFITNLKNDDARKQAIEEMKAIKGTEFYVSVMTRIEKEGMNKIFKVVDSMRDILEKMEKPGKVLDSIRPRFNVYCEFLDIYDGREKEEL